MGWSFVLGEIMGRIFCGRMVGQNSLRDWQMQRVLRFLHCRRGLFSQFHPALPEAEKCAEGVEILTHVIASCAAVDTRHILVPMFPRDMDAWPDATWDQLVDGFKALGDVAEEHGVILDLETTFSADQLVMILDRVGSPAVKVYHDTGNTMTRGQDPAEEILKLGSDGVGMIHAKDTDRQALERRARGF